MNKFTNAFEIKHHYPESVREEGTTETTLNILLINLRFNCVMDSNLKFCLFGYISFYSG